MCWKEVKPMDQKIFFISEYLLNLFNFSELCSRFGISRKTGYKWIRRYQENGTAEALEDQSRRPKNSPSKTPKKVVDAILEVRSRYPSWGPRKILWRITQDLPNLQILPAPSTVALILKRNGRIKSRRKKTKRYHPGRPLTAMTAANDVWTADFKGHFKTLDGLYCYPLTIADGFSRYLFASKAMLSPLQASVKAVFKKLFEQYGLPKKIRTDNGNPFASNALGRLSRLSAWWIRLGIIPELIQPGCPQQNGRHERMHKTLKYETTIPPARDLEEQQKRFDAFLNVYNQQRPHEALGMKTPSSLYQASQRPLPKKISHIEYPAHYELRRVSKNCGIRWKNQRICVSQVLADEYIGLEEIDDGIWDVYYGPVWLGRLLEKQMKIQDEKGKLQRQNRTEKCNLCL